ncbi:MAG: RloB family protein [Xenococcaceae cyanobacterium]
MTSKRRFSCPTGKRTYRKLFVIATEGSITEPQYFDIFNNKNTTIQIRCLKDKYKNSSEQVLKRMQKHLEENELKNKDQAWLVVDKDQWSDITLNQLYEWTKKGLPT